MTQWVYSAEPGNEICYQAFLGDDPQLIPLIHKDTFLISQFDSSPSGSAAVVRFASSPFSFLGSSTPEYEKYSQSQILISTGPNRRAESLGDISEHLWATDSTNTYLLTIAASGKRVSIWNANEITQLYELDIARILSTNRRVTSVALESNGQSVFIALTNGVIYRIRLLDQVLIQTISTALEPLKPHEQLSPYIRIVGEYLFYTKNIDARANWSWSGYGSNDLAVYDLNSSKIVWSGSFAGPFRWMDYNPVHKTLMGVEHGELVVIHLVAGLESEVPDVHGGIESALWNQEGDAVAVITRTIQKITEQDYRERFLVSVYEVKNNGEFDFKLKQQHGLDPMNLKTESVTGWSLTRDSAQRWLLASVVEKGSAPLGRQDSPSSRLDVYIVSKEGLWLIGRQSSLFSLKQNESQRPRNNIQLGIGKNRIPFVWVEQSDYLTIEKLDEEKPGNLVLFEMDFKTQLEIPNKTDTVRFSGIDPTIVPDIKVQDFSGISVDLESELLHGAEGLPFQKPKEFSYVSQKVRIQDAQKKLGDLLSDETLWDALVTDDGAVVVINQEKVVSVFRLQSGSCRRVSQFEADIPEGTNGLMLIIGPMDTVWIASAHNNGQVGDSYFGWFRLSDGSLVQPKDRYPRGAVVFDMASGHFPRYDTRGYLLIPQETEHGAINTIVFRISKR